MSSISAIHPSSSVSTTILAVHPTISLPLNATLTTSSSGFFNSTGTGSMKPTASIKPTTIYVDTCLALTCSKIPIVTGVTTVTIGSTEYTTYCPLTPTSPPATSVVACVEEKCVNPPGGKAIDSANSTSTISKTLGTDSPLVNSSGESPATGSVSALAPLSNGSAEASTVVPESDGHSLIASGFLAVLVTCVTFLL